MDVDTFAGRHVVFWAVGMNFYLEIAKMRPARLLWHRIMTGFGAKNAKSMMLRTHSQTSGWSLTEQDPYNNVVRTTIEAMAAVSAAPSRCTPTRSTSHRAADRVLGPYRPQHPAIIQEETHITNVIDPWAGSYMMEKADPGHGRQGLGHHPGNRGHGRHDQGRRIGWAKMVETCAADKQARIDSGKTSSSASTNTSWPRRRHRHPDIDNHAVREAQVERLKPASARCATAPADAALAALTRVRQTGEGNLLDLTVKAIRLRATVGEVSDALERLRSLPCQQPDHFRRLWRRCARSTDRGRDQGRCRQVRREEGRRPRIMIAKLGQDSHDRGAKVVATAHADLGFDIDMGPLPDAGRGCPPGHRKRRAC